MMRIGFDGRIELIAEDKLHSSDLLIVTLVGEKLFSLDIATEVTLRACKRFSIAMSPFMQRHHVFPIRGQDLPIVLNWTDDRRRFRDKLVPRLVKMLYQSAPGARRDDIYRALEVLLDGAS